MRAGHAGAEAAPRPADPRSATCERSVNSAFEKLSGSYRNALEQLTLAFLPSRVAAKSRDPVVWWISIH